MRKVTNAAAFLAAIAALVVALGAGNGAVAQDALTGTPPGAVSAYAGANPPPGYLMADGSEVSRTQYPLLFQAIGTTYGSSSSTTFRLPDLQGRVVAGRGTNAQVDQLNDNDGLTVSSRKVGHKHGRGTLAIGSSGGHTHGLPVFANDTGRAHFDFYGAEGTDGWTGIGTYTLGGGNHSHPNTSVTGEVGDTSGPAENPAFITLNYIIKY